MTKTWCITLFFLGIQSAWTAPQDKPARVAIETRYCAYYNGTQPSCDPNDPGCATQREECQPIENDKSNHCFQLWHYDSTTNSSTLRFKGCFLDTVSCMDRSAPCRIHNAKLLLLTCCCEGDMCNANDTFPGLPMPLYFHG